MAVATEVLTDVQRATLRAFCDTVVPAVENADGEGPELRAYFARPASQLMVCGPPTGM